MGDARTLHLIRFPLSELSSVAFVTLKLMMQKGPVDMDCNSVCKLLGDMTCFEQVWTKMAKPTTYVLAFMSWTQDVRTQCSVCCVWRNICCAVTAVFAMGIETM